MNLNLKSQVPQNYDAIVIGSGISGGWAAKELCEKGLKILVLERGRNLEHVKDYPTAMKRPWDFENRLLRTNQDLIDNPVQCQAYNEGNKHFFVSDQEHPYEQQKPFHWIRGYQVGGRSLTWGRQSYRLSDLDFEANAKDGIGVDWPIRYKDIAPWYDYVESYVGISGSKEGLAHLPDGNFLPPIEMNCIESHFKKKVAERYKDRLVTNGRTANLTEKVNGRGPCQYRNLCSRGCPFNGFFSSNGVTLPAAMDTGNMTLRPFSIVSEILYDKETKRATGVRVIDTETHEELEFYAKVIFVNASTIATASILLQSKSESFPDGLGNSSGQVGHHLMDHFVGAGAEGEMSEYLDQYYSGRNPGCIYVPRFRNIDDKTKQSDFIRGYGFQGYGERTGWNDNFAMIDGFGADYKNKLTEAGPWRLWLGAWGETLPYYDNAVSLSPDKKDQWGLPILRINFEYHENELAMRQDIKDNAFEMLDNAGFKNINVFDYPRPGGAAVHEMGTARMGLDPKTSVLNANNQLHDVPNVYITDGSCMTSSGTQNPSLTYMALTARACAHAVEQLRNGSL